MADDKKMQDGRDRSKVSGSESYELSYLEEELSVSRDEVKEAIKIVGNNRDAVKKYLQENKGHSK